MCDASNYAIGVILKEHIDRKPYVICYVSHTLNEALLNYTVTEKEFSVVLFDFKNFRPCLIGSSVIVHIDHAALKHLFYKKDAKSILFRRIGFYESLNVRIGIKMVLRTGC